jgi:hypothetical protein
MGRLQPGRRVRDLILAGQPLEELLHPAVLVAGVRGAVPVQQPDDPLLHVPLPDLFPVRAVTLPEQVRCREPPHRVGVGPYRLGGLALSGQVQPERADLRLEASGVQLLGPTG